MTQPVLHCFAQSGHSYKVALFLTLAGIDWRAQFVDFFGGQTRSPEFRALNPMGECPVLEMDGRVMTQSGMILGVLARQTGRFAAPDAASADEVARWLFWDAHKGSSQFGAARFMMNFLSPDKRDPAVNHWLAGRVRAALATLDGHLSGRDWLVGDAPTIADLSCCSYLFFPEEFGLDRTCLPGIDAWLARIAALPHWQHPYALMPGAPQGWTASANASGKERDQS